MPDFNQLKDFLDEKVVEYNRLEFIGPDPISIPHRFSKKQDIEIAGFFAAVFAWGNRTTIIQKSLQLMELMDDAPFDFISTHQEGDLKKMLAFKHRTFNTTDLLYFILFLKHHYTKADSLETAFSQWMKPRDKTTEGALAGFHDYFFSLPDAPVRTRKHIATPVRNASCKRLSMYLRWMVRSDQQKVDFGIWKNIHPSQLVCPVDVHVARVARHLKLMRDEKVNWKTALALTAKLRRLDPADPVKYDFALFGLGVSHAF